MPSRVVRDEIRRSESLSRVSPEAELTFDRLIVACDDYGRLDARPRVLKSELFPLRDAFTPERVAVLVEELDREGCVLVYEVDGRPYLQLTGWEKHRGKGRRGPKSRFPAPPVQPRNLRESEESADSLPRVEGRESKGEGERDETAAADAASLSLCSAGGRKTKTPAPERFSADERAELVRFTAEQKPTLLPDLDVVLEKFLRHKASKGELLADWVEGAKAWILAERREPAAHQQSTTPPTETRDALAARHRAELDAQFGPGPSHERQCHLAALLERAVGVNREVLWALEYEESQRICKSERDLPARVSPVAALGATA